MGNPFKALIAGGVVGAVAWSFREYQKGVEAAGHAEHYRLYQASTPAPQPQRDSNPLSGLFASFAGNLFDAIPESVQDAIAPVGGQLRDVVQRVAPDVAQFIPDVPFLGGNIGGGTSEILAIIRKHESGGNYNIVWGGIAAKDQPPRQLTQMTIAQVLAWQDSIDSDYMSEAAGAYQILEDTLRGLYRSAGLSPASLFNVANQDRLAVALLERRGLSRYRQGDLTEKDFGQNLAKEWASFPAQTKDKRGRTATGQSYYAGDGLNRSLTSKSQVLSAIRRI